MAWRPKPEAIDAECLPLPSLPDLPQWEVRFRYPGQGDYFRMTAVASRDELPLWFQRNLPVDAGWSWTESGFENGRVSYQYRAIPHVPCPDCGATGVYKGLHVVEACRACGGTGQKKTG